MARPSFPIGLNSCWFLALAAIVPAPVLGAGYETLSPSQASRIGMIAQWQDQMTIAGGFTGVVDAQIYVDQTRIEKIIQVTADDSVLLRIRANQTNQYGQPIGVDEAKRLAQMEVYKLRRRGITATVGEIEVPQVRLYVLGADGTVEARDAENGRILWTERYGDPRLPCLPMAVNNNFVFFINGVTLFVLDAITGDQIATRDFHAVPLFGPAIVGEYVMAVCTGRSVEGFPLGNFAADRFTAMVAGLPMAAPVTAPGSARMMWPTDAGFVYALDGAGKAGLVFRFPADGLVSAEIAAGLGNRFYMATEKGLVYALSAELNGRWLWRQSLGEAVYDSPLLVGERLYVRTVYGNLFCLNATDGQFTWPRPNAQVDKILGATEKQVLVRTISAELESIDASTGTVLAEFHGTAPAGSVRNPATNRIYLLTLSGVIQCLRPIDSELSKILLAPLGPPATGAAATGANGETGEEETDEENPEAGTEDDPFGGVDNPFGGTGEDPFGGDGSDPFGDTGGDPFGAPGADPFSQ